MSVSPNISGHPSSDEVRAHLKYELYCVLARHVPASVLLAVSERLDEAIGQELDRPAGYDNVRPLLLMRIGQLFSEKGYPLTAEAEADTERFIHKQMNKQNVGLYHLDIVWALSEEFLASGVDDEMQPSDVGRRHGFTISDDGEWYSRALLRVHRNNITRALKLALAKAGKILPDPAR